MAVTIKSHSEIELMRKSCKLLSTVHEEMGHSLKPGMSTYEINMIGEKLIKKLGCECRTLKIITVSQRQYVYQ